MVARDGIVQKNTSVTFPAFVQGGRLIEYIDTRQYEVGQCAAAYGVGKTKRLHFIALTAAKDRDRLEATEIAACAALLDDLKLAGEGLLDDLHVVEELEAFLREATERYTQAVAGDDIEEEDTAGKAVQEIECHLETAKLQLSRNTANAQLYHAMMAQLRGRAGDKYGLSEGERDLLAVLDAREEVRIDSEKVMSRRSTAVSARQKAVFMLQQAKKPISKLEYQIGRKDGDREKARMAQDVEGERIAKEALAKLREEMAAVQQKIAACSLELDNAELELGQCEREKLRVAGRQEEISMAKREADEEVAKGWNARVGQAIVRAESKEEVWPMNRLRFLERHRQFDEAAVQWQNVKEVRSDPLLVVEVLRTCFCADHTSDVVDRLMKKVLQQWFPLEKREAEATKAADAKSYGCVSI